MPRMSLGAAGRLNARAARTATTTNPPTEGGDEAEAGEPKNL